MRQLVFGVFAVALSLGGIVGSTAQTSTPSMWITITAGAAGYATVAVARSEMYIDGGPVAGIGPRGGGTSSPPLMFNIRAWNEGQKARVVVYARLRDERAPEGATETPIATFVMGPAETREVPEAEKWGGPGLILSARGTNAHR